MELTISRARIVLPSQEVPQLSGSCAKLWQDYIDHNGKNVTEDGEVFLLSFKEKHSYDPYESGLIWHRSRERGHVVLSRRKAKLVKTKNEMRPTTQAGPQLWQRNRRRRNSWTNLKQSVSTGQCDEFHRYSLRAWSCQIRYRLLRSGWIIIHCLWWGIWQPKKK